MDFKGDRLRALKQARGWTDREEQAATGLTQSTLWDLSSGRIRHPHDKTLTKLCAGYGVDRSYFFAEQVPAAVLPEMSEELLAFVLASENIPLLQLAQEAKKRGIPPARLIRMINFLADDKNE